MSEVLNGISGIFATPVVLITISALASACGAIVTAYSVYKMRAQNTKALAMKIAEALVLRDRSIKNSILMSVPEDRRAELRDLLERAFATGDRDWAAESIGQDLGKEASDEIRQRVLGTDKAGGH